LKSPDDLIDVLAPKITAMRAERGRLDAELETLDRPARESDRDREADDLVKQLWGCILSCSTRNRHASGKSSGGS
jgi:hypothetical protein